MDRDPAVTALIVCADPHVAALLEFTIQAHDIHTTTTTETDAVLHLLHTESLHLVVLDLEPIPDDHLKLCRHIHEQTDVPVMIVSRSDHRADVVTGLEHGADDYLVHPFHPRELGLRARSLTRPHRRGSRTHGDSGAAAIQQIGRLSIDQTRHTATIAGRPIDLTYIEFRLLAHLAAHRGTPQTWQTLLRTVWEAHTLAGGRDIIKSAIYRLRTRLANYDSTVYIHTLRGVGYLMPDLPPTPALVPNSRDRAC
jgi:DNA-binding response OmpR family regulator